MKKEQNGRESLRKLEFIVGFNASKRRRKRLNRIGKTWTGIVWVWMWAFVNTKMNIRFP